MTALTSVIPTEEIPQADRLDRVIEAARLVSRGKNSYQAIASEIGFTERQGRYYRRAAEILGLIRRISTNRDSITSFGRQVITASGRQQSTLLARRVADLPTVQSVLAMLSTSQTSTSDDLARALTASTSTTPTMVERRLSTILSWLESVGIIRITQARINLVTVPKELISIPVQLPVLPKIVDLKPYREVPRRLRRASSALTYEVDQVKRERASSVHERLRSLVAKKIKDRCQVTPTSNSLIDLAAAIRGLDYIIEVKSTTKENVRSQVWRGVSQLYEYRYLNVNPSAKLVLLLEEPLKGEVEWLKDYVVNDRGIYLIWDARNDKLFTTSEGRALPFL